MTPKRILGLDLGTNSIGWALIQSDFENKRGKILGMGTRIIPMTQDIKDDFGKGNSVSRTAERTNFRSVRRLRERHLSRRYRLHRVLNVLNFLPDHYAGAIDFNKRLGHFINDSEPKIAWKKNDSGKYEFVFQQSFNEMLAEFKANGTTGNIPYDWTIYYLRKKAITRKISKEELAWIILNFNQKRGYYQLRGEEESENTNKLVEFHSLTVVDVVPDTETSYKGELWYSLRLQNGWIYRRSGISDISDWIGKTMDFIVTTDLNDDGTIKTDKTGAEKRSFRAPKEDDWTLIKTKTEQDISKSQKTVGAFIYEGLLNNPKQKIRGRLVRTVERKFYKAELISILEKQIELQPELFTNDIYNNCVRELYRNNESHQTQLSKRDFIHLFVNDIIFYQRPLKSKKSSVGDCSLEYRTFFSKDKNGNKILQKQYLKAIPKSHPLYQEFRIWQWLYNLRLFKREDDTDITSTFITSIEDIEQLFEFLMSQKEIDHKVLIKYLLTPSNLKGKNLTNEISRYRWNYVFDNETNESKKYPMNDTVYEIKKRLRKISDIDIDYFTEELIHQLWHLIYSVTDKTDYEKALKTFAAKHNLDTNSFVDNFIKFPPFKSEFGSYSLKAVKKLLTLMRIGKYWNWPNVDGNTKNRISKIINGEFDETIKVRVREKATKHKLNTENDFQGLPLWLAQYVVYDRHSEGEATDKWSSVKDLRDYLFNFKQHSLRNPIVEQVVTETLRVVGDIWEKFGKGATSYFNEIHVELAREMKKTADERKFLTATINRNESTNQRLKELLIELKENTDGSLKVENVRPFSPMQQEALKIFEEGSLCASNVPDEIIKISKTALPTKSELQRYKLWLEQNYRSPYTGNIIPLSKLFTAAYEIEHVIPQSRYFDDSLSNKVICESAVNKLKDKQLGLEFIKKHSGEKIQDGNEYFQILTEVEYKDFIKNYYSKNQTKRKKLLLEEVPESMINRQLNDTRHISRFISNILSNIVREQDGKDDELRSKNVLPGNGIITQKLRQEWGLNDVWNDLMLPRFEQMNLLTNSERYTSLTKSGKTIGIVPLEYAKGFQKKRIDHRHHALDALVIASATREHIQYLNNENAKSQKFHLQIALAKKLRNFETIYTPKWENTVNNTWAKTNEKIKKTVPCSYIKPWETFTQDARYNLERIVVTFKKNLRVISKTTNYYENYKDEDGKIRIGTDGKPKKGFIKQSKGENRAIRKSMHQATVSGKVHLPRIKVPKGKILTATRKSIDTSFNLKTIQSITDTGIQKILTSYLQYKSGNSDIAFSKEGLAAMNANIGQFNNGKPHQPIFKVRIFELGSKFSLGESGNKKQKYVEAAKGTNLFFAIYQKDNGKRSYETIPLNIVIERLKQGLSAVPEINEKGFPILYYLSPNDIIYLPTLEEQEDTSAIDFSSLSKDQMGRLYKIVSFTGGRLYGIPLSVASPIVNKVEYTQLNKVELINQKDSCIKLEVDRIGNLSKALLK